MGHHTSVEIIDLTVVAEKLSVLTDHQKVAVLVDEHTFDHCYPIVGNDGVDLLLVPTGEEAKSLEVVQFLWESLINLGYGRSDYLVSLGGGAISDLAGFVASTYMRGMHLVHIPTTLLGMVDASIGGKTAIDYHSVKNLIGTFYEPEEVWVALDFLNSLPEIEIQSGLGEMVKYGLLIDKELFDLTLDIDQLSPDVIARVMQFKLDVVANDFRDRGGRAILNLGHTTAHGLEGWKLSRGEVLPHGIAVVAGLVVALYVSYKWFHLEESVLTSLARSAKASFPKVFFTCDDYDAIWDFAIKDKKNVVEGELSMVLLRAVGDPIIAQVTYEQWLEAMDFYRDFMH